MDLHDQDVHGADVRRQAQGFCVLQEVAGSAEQLALSQLLLGPNTGGKWQCWVINHILVLFSFYERLFRIE